jgi:septum formation protein
MLLEAFGVEFETVVPAVEELREGEPREVVAANALRKAEAAAGKPGKGTLVIACDTEVVVEGRVLGQPADEREARWCLQALSGRRHEVLGGLALLGPELTETGLRVREGVDSSAVSFADLSPSLVEAYLASGEWRGRAGGYAVQGLGSALVAGIEGDVSNVVGLPLRLLATLAPELLRSSRHN